MSLYQKSVKKHKHQKIIDKYLPSKNLIHPGFSTLCSRVPFLPEKEHGSINTPIYLTTTYA